MDFESTNIYFMTISVFHKQSAEKIEKLKSIYDIGFESIRKSYVCDIYWSATCTVVIPYMIQKYENDYMDLGEECVVFRKKNCVETKYPDCEEFMKLVLNSPFTTTSVPTEPITRRSQPKSSSQIKAYSVYRFPDLTDCQEGYIQNLFSTIAKKISDEQTSGGNLVKNTIINRVVSELTMEHIRGVWYLIFVYHEKATLRNSPCMTSTDMKSHVPESIDIDYIIPFDVDDDMEDLDLESNDIGIGETGENGVVYNMRLLKV